MYNKMYLKKVRCVTVILCSGRYCPQCLVYMEIWGLLVVLVENCYCIDRICEKTSSFRGLRLFFPLSNLCIQPGAWTLRAGVKCSADRASRESLGDFISKTE